MKSYLSQLAGMGLAATLTLAVQSSAQALDFSFSISDGTNDITGTISGLTEGVSSPTSVKATSSFLGWNELEFVGGSEYGAGTSSFTVVGGEIVDDNFSMRNGLGLHSSFLVLDGDGSKSGDPTVGYFGQRNPSPGTIADSSTTNMGGPGGFNAAIYSAATPVPFGVSADLSLLILGGLYGASRLRKTSAARKKISNQST